MYCYIRFKFLKYWLKSKDRLFVPQNHLQENSHHYQAVCNVIIIIITIITSTYSIHFFTSEEICSQNIFKWDQ